VNLHDVSASLSDVPSYSPIAGPALFQVRLLECFSQYWPERHSELRVATGPTSELVWRKTFHETLIQSFQF
jgi:hypothetical protein